MRKVIVFAFCVLLSGCSLMSEKECLPIDKPNLKLKDPPALNLNTVKFKVLHKENAEEYFNSVSSDSSKSTVFALTETDYKNLSINIEKIKSYIKTQKKIIQLYRNYYEGNQNGKNSKIKTVEKY